MRRTAAFIKTQSMEATHKLSRFTANYVIVNKTKLADGRWHTENGWLCFLGCHWFLLKVTAVRCPLCKKSHMSQASKPARAVHQYLITCCSRKALLDSGQVCPSLWQKRMRRGSVRFYINVLSHSGEASAQGLALVLSGK